MKLPDFVNQIKGWRSMFIFIQLFFVTICLLNHYLIIFYAYLLFQLLFSFFCIRFNIFELNTKRNNFVFSPILNFALWQGFLITTLLFVPLFSATVIEFSLAFIDVDTIHLQSEGFLSIFKSNTVNYTLLVFLSSWLIDTVIMILFGWLTPKATVLKITALEENE